MNLIRILVILLLGLSSALGLAQPPPEPKSNKFSTLTVEEAKKLLRYAPVEEREELTNAVLESGRLDLVEAAWLMLGNKLRANVDAMPYSRYKEDVLLLMLKTDSGYWPDTITFGSR